jgi:hypothetical protein
MFSYIGSFAVNFLYYPLNDGSDERNIHLNFLVCFSIFLWFGIVELIIDRTLWKEL